MSRNTSTRDAIGLGIGMVHQHFMLVSTLTVAENIMLGAEPTRWGFIEHSNSKQTIRKLSEDFGLTVDPEAVAGNLPVGVQQRVEIIKALYRGARILVLDEPTAVLTPSEVAKLFGVLLQLRASGASIIFISHKLGETIEPSQSVAALSGGNQQKVLLSRELSLETRLLIANQPTRLDVGAVEYVHRRLLAMRDRGVAVLLISVELDEIMSLSDTIAVMYEGQFAAINPVDQVSAEQLGLLMTAG